MLVARPTYCPPQGGVETQGSLSYSPRMAARSKTSRYRENPEVLATCRQLATCCPLQVASLVYSSSQRPLPSVSCCVMLGLPVGSDCHLD